MAADKTQLKQLMALRKKNLPDWFIGKIPHHYKRISVDSEEMMRLALYGYSEVNTMFGDSLYFTQAVIAGAILSRKYYRIILCTPSQYGKALDDETPVLTRDGWKRHGDLKVGDEVVGLDGKFVKVLAVSPKCEMDRIVTLQNGDEFICHHNHEWVYQYKSRGECENRAISVGRMEERGLMLPDGHKKFVIPKHDFVEGENKELAVPPYVMGVWLGDGSTTKGQICACKDDIAVLDKCREFYPDGKEWGHKDTGVITRSFIGLANDLTEYNMCFQRKDTPRKHIPEEYLTASVEQRLELLAGLIDTDGYTYHDPRYKGHARLVFTTADETLKDSFESLISTFGWRTSTLKVKPRESSSGIKGKHEYWVIGFTPSCEIPCVLERKRVVIAGRTETGIGITDIRETHGRQGNCIQVEGGTYLVGKHMIPTHNSWLLGRITVIQAHDGEVVFVAGGRKATTEIIMGHMLNSLHQMPEDVQKELLESKDQIEKLGKSLSKTKISYRNGGSVEGITLGDTFSDKAGNNAIGRGGNYFVDEAALVSEDTLAELGRIDFSKLHGEKCQLVMISNPHRPGVFYDELTQDEVPEGTFILWADALTAVEEERFTEEAVLNGEFTKNKSTLRRYLLCELDVSGESMFETPHIYYDPIPESDVVYRFLGVDAAYKGKDNICAALVCVTRDAKVHCEEIYTVHKENWIDGETPKQIVREIARMARKTMAQLTCVDQGWGVWLINGLMNAGVPTKGIGFQWKPTPERVKANNYAATNAQQMRAEMHLDLQDLIDKGAFDIQIDAYDQIKDILPFVLCDRKSNGKIQVRPKTEIRKSIGRSPDELDSLLLAIHAMIVFFGEGSVFADE